MYNYNLSAPEIVDCIFERNRAEKGGAMVNRVGSSPTVTGCRFAANHADFRGGALLIDYGSGPQVKDCVFVNNSSGGHGAGAFLESVAAQLGVVSTHFENCAFRGNVADLRGGGMANSDGGNPVLTGCAFEGNRAGRGGGGVSNDYHVSVVLERCIFSHNIADEGQADVDTDGTSAVEMRG
jgi:hypothetical protein